MNPFQNIPNGRYIRSELADAELILFKSKRDDVIRVVFINTTKQVGTHGWKITLDVKNYNWFNIRATEFIDEYSRDQRNNINNNDFRLATSDDLSESDRKNKVVNDPRLAAPSSSDDQIDLSGLFGDPIDDNAVQHNAPNRNARNNSVNVRRGKMANQPVYVKIGDDFVEKISGDISRKILQLAHSRVNADAHRYPDGTFNRKTYMDAVTAERKRLANGWYRGDANIMQAINAVQLKEKRKSAYRECWYNPETKQNVKDAVRAVRKQVRTSMCGHLKDQTDNMAKAQQKLAVARSHFNNPYESYGNLPRLQNLRQDQLQQLKQLADVLFPGN